VAYSRSLASAVVAPIGRVPAITRNFSDTILFFASPYPHPKKIKFTKATSYRVIVLVTNDDERIFCNERKEIYNFTNQS
jgi:hypothetical protein